MSEDRPGNDPEDSRSWIEKIAHAFTAEPKSRKEFIELLDAARENEILDPEALEMIDGALQVSEQQVREAMIPRPQMVVVKADSNPAEFLPAIIESAHSRFPVVGETIDDVLGILLAKDLLPFLLESSLDNIDLASLMRPVNFVPESKRLNVLLKEFRENRHHMAVVIDEYGGVAGLITIEDVLEEIVGEIEDETDAVTDTPIKKIADNDFVVKALTPIEEFNDYFNAELDDNEFDTIGGLVMRNFGYLPKRNEVTRIDNFNIRVLNADNRRIHLLRLSALTE